MNQIIYQVDAFAKSPFSGNPAGVCVLDRPRDETWVQNIALEMNLSETAFLVQREDGFNLRWFTPACEVDLCGHATLASAHILWETEILKPGELARFHTRSGLLTASLYGGWIDLDFPTEPPEETPPPTGLIESLGIDSVFVGKNRMDIIVEADSSEAVRKMKPDFTRLSTIETRGVIVTARSDSPEYDFISRFFAPRVGINEDPVTGSAHCCLGPYWSKRLGKQELSAYQASPRGGEMRVEVNNSRIILSGQAITVLRAELLS